MAQTVKSFCNSCSRETDHCVDWQHANIRKEAGVTTEEFRYLSVHCLGCQDISSREEHWVSQNGALALTDIRYSPPRLWRRPPGWLSDLKGTDLTLFELLREVYSATNDTQIRLLAMGVRAALDHVMVQILGGDNGGFEEKLKDMAKNGHITDKQRENLSIVIDAASASSHRGYRPPHELVEEMVVVMETIIRDHHITGPMLQVAKPLIPPRPPRKPAKP